MRAQLEQAKQSWLATNRAGRSPHVVPVDGLNDRYAECGIKFGAGSYSEPGALHPRRVIAWSSFPKDATRFTFAG